MSLSAKSSEVRETTWSSFAKAHMLEFVATNGHFSNGICFKVSS